MGILFYPLTTLKPYFPANKSLTKWCEVICDALHDLVPFVQFKKREKHLWRSVTFSKFSGYKPSTLLKVTLLSGCFSRFLICRSGTKSCNASLSSFLHYFNCFLEHIDKYNFFFYIGRPTV